MLNRKCIVAEFAELVFNFRKIADYFKPKEEFDKDIQQ